MRAEQDWHEKISQPIHEMATYLDEVIGMRDGVNLYADIHRPAEDGRFPALLAYQPWGKDHEALGLDFPNQRRPSNLWDGAIEGGDSNYFVERGYAHIVVDARGTGASGGDLPGIMGAGGPGEGADMYDTVEWIAEQPWCDGNVGMVGISYLAAVQVIAAATKPPHLRAIFPEGGHYDVYRHTYHGGILWLMPRAALRGRGSDSGLAVANPPSYTRDALGDEAFEALLKQRLEDPEIRYFPNYHQLLNYPYLDSIWLDYILNPYDSEFYWGEGKADERMASVEVPVHFGVQLGRGWQLDETIHAYQQASGEKRLMIRPGPPMQERPFHEFHDEIVRWYDHWLKGVDTGVLDEPPIKVFVEGANKWRHSSVWPLPETQWEKLYLRPGGRLLQEPEKLGADAAPPDGFYQAPLRVTNRVESLSYVSDPFTEPVELVGPAAFNLFAEIDATDTNWILRLFDVAPNGDKTVLTTGWLKASHRELDEELSQPWAPHHPHTRSVPVEPGAIEEYAIRVYPMSCQIDIGHRLELELRNCEGADSINPMLPPESGHLNLGHAVTHKIYRDRERQSHLVLPVVRDAALS